MPLRSCCRAHTRRGRCGSYCRGLRSLCRSIRTRRRRHLRHSSSPTNTRPTGYAETGGPIGGSGPEGPPLLTADVFVDAHKAGAVPRGGRRLRGLLPDEPGVIVPDRIVIERSQQHKPLRRRQRLVPVRRDAAQVHSPCALRQGGWSAP
jgi:hypothetical protein